MRSNVLFFVASSVLLVTSCSKSVSPLNSHLSQAVKWMDSVGSRIVNVSDGSAAIKTLSKGDSPKQYPYAVGSDLKRFGLVALSRISAEAIVNPYSSCISVSGNLNDLDNDSIPANATLTYNCRYYSNEGYITISGSTNIIDGNDSSPTSGQSTANNITYRSVINPSRVWTTHNSTSVSPDVYTPPKSTSFTKSSIKASSDVDPILSYIVTYVDESSSPDQTTNTKFDGTYKASSSADVFKDGIVNGQGALRDAEDVSITANSIKITDQCGTNSIESGQIEVKQGSKVDDVNFQNCKATGEGL